MTRTIRWGILGCGRIAHKFAADLQHVPDAMLTALGSRSRSNAEAFAASFPVAHIHDSYEALVSNPEVDVIYVASPHGLHHEHVLLCLQHNKAVLCEKAFAINSRQAREMIGMAKEKKVFLMEALWTKFLPPYQIVQQMIREGKLGDLQSVLVNFGFIPPHPAPVRLYDSALGGGSLLDIGIYNVFMALSVLGKPDRIEASMKATVTGVDEQCAILFKYKNGAMAQLFSSLSSNLAIEADISGNKARLRLGSRFFDPFTTITFYPDRFDSGQVIPFPKEPGFGYQYEARHVGDCLRMDLTESPVMTHEDTLLIMDTLDRIREAAGIKYDVD